MAIQWISGTITRRHVWSDGLFTLSIHCPGVEAFEPGQYLQLGMELPEKHLHRPYSVASPHGDSLEFFIVRVDEGALTPRLWALEEGQSIDVSSRAQGSFTLSHAPPARCLWLVATGTGLAPYIAMLRHHDVWDRYTKIIVVHGVRHARDIAYVDELNSYREQYPDRFQWLTVTSREVVPGSLHGRITQLLASGGLEAATGELIGPEDSTWLLCGNPDMLNEMEERLVARGLTRQKPKQAGQIVVERYW